MKNSATQQRRSTSNGASRDQNSSVSRRESLDPVGDVRDYAIRYFKEQPEVSALACLGIGFILGWKLKPW